MRITLMAQGFYAAFVHLYAFPLCILACAIRKKGRVFFKPPS
jgi:hypothetical protein